MNMNYATVCALLAVATLTAEDDKVTLTTSQLQAIEDKLSALQESINVKTTELTARQTDLDAKAAEVARLQAELAELKKRPGDESSTVIDDHSHAGKSEMDEYFDTVNKASALLASLS